MPESKKRKQVVERRKEAAHERAERPAAADKDMHSPRWWAPLMVVLMLLGLLIVVMAYVTGGTLPIPNGGNWNIFAGLIIMIVGFLMTMGWK